MTGTAISRRLAGGLAIGLACAGCGSPSYGAAGGAPRGPASTSSGRLSHAASTPSGAFAWFAAQPPPRGWRLARVPSGAALPYPRHWRLLRGDPGTATAALRTSRGAYLGYLNLTPRQGQEGLANWHSFRIKHNREEGDRDVKELAAADGLHFRAGRGNCVKDSYLGATGRPYVEIACLIVGPKVSVVAVGAAPPSAWRSQSAVIERALEGVDG